MTEPFRGEIHEKSKPEDPVYVKTYETDDYQSVSDAMQDVVYEIAANNINTSEEVTQVIIVETED